MRLVVETQEDTLIPLGCRILNPLCCNAGFKFYFRIVRTYAFHLWSSTLLFSRTVVSDFATFSSDRFSGQLLNTVLR
jgi:hypothetical protein